MTNPRLDLRKIAWRICAVALACAAMEVPAQMVFKQVSLAGNITYTDQPETTAPAQEADSPELAAPKVKHRIANISPRRVTAVVDAKEAALRLRKAQLQRQHGAQPLAGEQTHANGESTPNYRYWRRQERLRNLVEQAQRRSNEAGRVQLALR